MYHFQKVCSLHTVTRFIDHLDFFNFFSLYLVCERMHMCVHVHVFCLCVYVFVSIMSVCMCYVVCVVCVSWLYVYHVSVCAMSASFFTCCLKVSN